MGQFAHYLLLFLMVSFLKLNSFLPLKTNQADFNFFEFEMTITAKNKTSQA